MARSEFNAEEIYQTITKKEQTEPVEAFDEAISITDFMKDLSLRFKKDYESAVQLYVYFYRKESTYTLLRTNSYGSKRYIVFRPEMITFVYYNKESKEIKHKIRTKGLTAYRDYGVKFETNVPMYKWDDSSKRYTKDLLKDEKGSVKFKSTHELKTDCKVNMLQINTKEETYVKKAGVFDICDTEVRYYNWRVVGVPDTRNDSKLLVEKVCPTPAQFDNVDAKLDDNATSKEDLNMELADDEEDEE